MDTLVLDADFRPHATIKWQEAICMVLLGKARPLQEYENWQIRSPGLTIKVPAVLLLVKYVGFKQPVKFSRANVYARDKYTCQYCGSSVTKKTISSKDLTFDHVIPRSKGGATDWYNIVTCCKRCNNRKADRTPQEARMSLLKEPKRPKRLTEVEYTLSKSASVPVLWKDYLYWNEDLRQLF